MKWPEPVVTLLLSGTLGADSVFPLMFLIQNETWKITLTWDIFKKKLVQFSERGIKILKTVFVRVMWVTTKLSSILSIFLVASFLVANTIQTCVYDSSCLLVRGSNTLGEMPLGIFDGISVYPAQHNSIKWDPRLPKNKLSPSMHLALIPDWTQCVQHLHAPVPSLLGHDCQTFCPVTKKKQIHLSCSRHPNSSILVAQKNSGKTLSATKMADSITVW